MTADAHIYSKGLTPIIRVQPVTLRAYKLLEGFPHDEDGAIVIHVDAFDHPAGPIALLDVSGFSTMTF